MKQKVVAGITVGFFLAFPLSFPAMAQQGWYGSIAVGSSRADVDPTQLVITGATANTYGKDETDVGFKVLGGYQFNANLALEGGYVNLGKGSASNTMTAPATGSLNSRFKSDGWLVQAVGILSVGNDFSLFGKLGTIYSTVKTDLTTSGAVVLAPGQAASRKRSEWNVAYGIGAGYRITKSVDVRLDWDRYQDLGNKGCNTCTGESDVDLISVGVNFRF